MIRLVFDCLRAPYDFANILQVVLATKECEVHITGNSLHHNHPKVLGKVASWSAKIRKSGLPKLPIHYYDSFKNCVAELKAAGIKIIGTSSHAKKSFYDLDLSDDKYAIVFGSESTGLSRQKASLVDEMVKIPMSDEVDFMTLSVVVPIVVYEALRQKG